MADVLAAAVRDRQRVPEPVMEIEFEREILMLDRKTCAEARDAGPAVDAARTTSPGGSSCPDLLDALTQAGRSQTGGGPGSTRATSRTSAAGGRRRSEGGHGAERAVAPS